MYDPDTGNPGTVPVMGLHPTSSLIRLAGFYLSNMIYRLSRSTLAFVWFWHGLVPKLIVRHPDEYLPLTAMGISRSNAEIVVAVAGWGEILFALMIVILWRARWPLQISILAMVGLLIGVLCTVPSLALGAFTPVTLNISVIAVAAIALFSDPYRNGKGRVNRTTSTLH